MIFFIIIATVTKPVYSLQRQISHFKWQAGVQWPSPITVWNRVFDLPGSRKTYAESGTPTACSWECLSRRNGCSRTPPKFEVFLFLKAILSDMLTDFRESAN